MCDLACEVALDSLVCALDAIHLATFLPTRRELAGSNCRGGAIRISADLAGKRIADLKTLRHQRGSQVTAVQIERGAARTARDFLGFWTDAALDRDQVARGCCPD